jgi:predicted membrane-bound spermidine synthase
MPHRLLARLRHAAAFVRSFFRQQVLARSQWGAHPAVRVVMRNGRKRLDGPTVNYSFGPLHAIFAEALQCTDVGRRAPRSVLLLGLGAGSVVALLRRTHGIEAPIVAVEVDAEVVRLATEHFGLRRWRDLEIVVGDAAAFVAADRRTFDLVVVDAFADAMVPAALREQSFLTALRERVAPGGLLLFNMITATLAAAAYRPPFERTLRSLFPSTTALPIRSNVVFAAERAPGDAPARADR